MESTNLKIQNEELKLTKEGFFRIFNALRREGMSVHQAYIKISSTCAKNGCKNYYNTLDSLKAAIYITNKKY